MDKNMTQKKESGMNCDSKLCRIRRSDWERGNLSGRALLGQIFTLKNSTAEKVVLATFKIAPLKN